MPTSGVTHDAVLVQGANEYGFMLQQGSQVEERVNDFAPAIGVSDNPAFAEGAWRAWEQNGGTEGIDQRRFTNEQKILWSDGNVDLSRDGKMQLASAWAVSDAAKAATAPQVLDFGTNRVCCAIGTKVRRFDTSAETWADSATTLAANAASLHVHNGKAFAACGSGADFYRSTDLDTWTQPAAGQKATCFATWDEKLWLANGATIKSSTDDGATWGAAINVGDPGSNVTALLPAYNYLYIRKEDGLFYYDGSSVIEVFTKRNTLYSGNKTLVYHDGFLYIGELGRIKKLSISSGAIANMVDITPDMAGDKDKDLYGHGVPVWMWSGPEQLYVLLDDGEGVYPEVLSYNGLGWHQVYRGTSGDTARAGGYSRLKAWTFVNDGATRRKKMTTLRDVPFPDYPATGEFHTSFFDAGLPPMPKGFGAVRVWARNVTATRYITVYYRDNEDDAWTELGSVAADVYPDPVTLVFDAADKSIGANALQLRFVLTTDSATETPVLELFSVKYINRPQAVHAYSLNLQLKNGQALLNRAAETVGVTERLAYLRQVEDSLEPIVYWDRQRRKHLVYVTKVTFNHPVYPVVGDEEVNVTLVMVDAGSGLWPQPDRMGLALDVGDAATDLVAQSTFSWAGGVDGTYPDEFDWDYGAWE